MSNPNVTAHVLRKLAKELDAPTRISAQGYQLEGAPFPSTVNNANFAKEYFMYNFARKRESSEADIKSMKKSLDKLVESERRCRIVNRYGGYYSPVGEHASVISELQRLTTGVISSMLHGRFAEVTDFCFTGGATAEARRVFCSPFAKGTGMPDPRAEGHNLACVPSALHLLIEGLERDPRLCDTLSRRRHRILDLDTPCEYDVVDLANWICSQGSSCVLDFVPKDLEEVRLLGKTGGMTMAIQKMLGQTFRDALLAVGIDITDQTVNQEWAEIGSYTGIIATVDMTSASDSIAMRCVNYFPDRFKYWIVNTRDREVTCGSTKHRLEKVALMGNGFIFEMQTILFYAMTVAVCKQLGLDASHVAVYGDDIICPSRAVPLLIEYLNFHGMQLNEKKSFYDHNGFRESCGKHYYKGRDVTPVYIKRELDVLQTKYDYYNQLSEWQSRTGVSIGGTLSLLGSTIPVHDRHYVPESFGYTAGLHFHIQDGKIPVRKWNKGYQRYVYTYKVLADRGVCVTERYPDRAIINALLTTLEVRDEVLRGAFRFPDPGSRFGRVVVFDLSETCPVRITSGKATRVSTHNE